MKDKTKLFFPFFPNYHYTDLHIKTLLANSKRMGFFLLETEELILPVLPQDSVGASDEKQALGI